MVALNPVNQLRTMAFQPIGAHGRQQRLTFGGQIGIQKRV
jgi:hypothetical protein